MFFLELMLYYHLELWKPIWRWKPVWQIEWEAALTIVENLSFICILNPEQACTLHVACNVWLSTLGSSTSTCVHVYLPDIPTYIPCFEKCTPLTQ